MSLWVGRALTLEKSPGIYCHCLIFFNSRAFWISFTIYLAARLVACLFFYQDSRAILRGFILASLVSQVFVGILPGVYQGLGDCLLLFWLVYAFQNCSGQLKPRYSLSGHCLGPVDYWHRHQFIRSWGKAPLCIRALVRDKA